MAYPESFRKLFKRVGVKGFNQPKRTPDHPEKSHIVVAKDGDEIKTIRFGQQGADTITDATKNPTPAQAAKKRAFKARHAQNIKKGRLSAAYWANKVKW